MNRKSMPQVLVSFLLACSLVGSLAPISYVSAHEETTHQTTSTSPEVLGVRSPSTQIVQANLDFQKALITYKQSTGNAKASALKQLVAFAKIRKTNMINEARNNPAGFLSSTVSDTTFNQLPADARTQVEQKVETTGKLIAVHVDTFNDKDSHYEFYLRDPQTKKSSQVFFAKGNPYTISNGTVKINGIRLQDTIVVEDANATSSGTSGVKIVTAPKVLNPIGDQRTLALRVKYSNTSSYNTTEAQITDNIFTGPHSVNAYFKESSYNMTSFSGDVTPVLNIPYDNSDCQNMYGTWADAADAAASAAGYNLNNYTHKIYYLENSVGCGANGRGEVGTDPSRAWIFLGPYFNTWPSAFYGTAIHELGHTMGMWHSSSLTCGSKVIDEYNKCQVSEYGDSIEVMGGSISTPNTLNGAHRSNLGFLTGSNVQLVNSSGTFTIAPLEVSGPSLKVLKIKKNNDVGYPEDVYYYIDYRQPIGSDANIPALLSQGANIIISPLPSNFATAKLDNTPGDSTMGNSALSDNAVFYDQLNNFTIKQLSHDANGVTLQITMNSSSCVRNAPSLVVSPITQTGVSGQTLSYNAAVTNNDSLSCQNTPDTFALTTSNLPSDFTTHLTSISLPPGGSGNVPMTVKSSPTTVGGTYNFTTQVTGPSGSKTQTVAYVVANSCIQLPPTMSITPASQTAGAGIPLDYTITINNRDSNCTASTFKVTTPNLPAGFTSTSPSVTVAASTSASTTLTVTSPSNATDNPYTINVNATDASAVSHFVSGTTSYVVHNPPVCNRAAPVVSVSPIIQSGTPGQALNYMVIVANKDATNCGNSTFNVSVPSLASGYTSNTVAVTSAPGSYGTGTLTVTSSSNTTSSTSFDIRAIDPSVSVHVGTTSATYIIDNICSYQNPSFNISPASQAGVAGQTLNYTTTITNNDSPACGPTTYYFAPLVPTELTGSSTPSSVTLNPGQSSTQIFAVTSATTSIPGDKEFVLRNSWVHGPMTARSVVTGSAVYTVTSSTTQTNVTMGGRGVVRGDSTSVPNLSPEMIARIKQLTNYLFPGVIFPKS